MIPTKIVTYSPMKTRKAINLTNNASVDDKLKSQRQFLTYEEDFEAAAVMKKKTTQRREKR